MRHCIGCKPQDWKEFSFYSYQSHAGGRGYAAPKVCLSAAYAWSHTVRNEFEKHKQRKVKQFKLPPSWQGEGICIVMHDGSTTTLGIMLRLYLPDASVKMYSKSHPNVHWAAPIRSHFIVMCEDGISQGYSLCKMRLRIRRPINLFLTIAGRSLDRISKRVKNKYKLSLEQIVIIHHQLYVSV